MKRLWATVVASAALLGCQTSQPTTNPFMRTTVAPPATGATVITPGVPYDPGAAPPVVGTTVAPGTPGVVTPGAAPVIAAPPPTAAPVMAPPPLTPPPTNNRYSPPGGSYQYNQS